MLTGWRLATLCSPESLARVTIQSTQSTLPRQLGSGEAELVALRAGLKPVVRQPLDARALEASRARPLPEGIHRLEAHPLGDRTLVFFAADPKRAEAAALADKSHDERALGELLGYPACCVAAFQSVRDRWWSPRSNLALAINARKNTRTTARARLNNLELGLFHYISWAPCSFDCAPSLTFADAVAKALTTRPGGWLAPEVTTPEKGFIERIDQLLGSHRLIWRGAQVSISGRVDGRTVHVDDAWPTFRDSPRHERDELRARAITLAAAIASTRKINLALFPFWGMQFFRFER